MRILEINSCNFGSTGNIMLCIAALARSQGNECCVCVPMRQDNTVKKVENQLFIGNRVTRNLHFQLAKITGFNGCFSYFSTIRFLDKIEAYKPDILHVHNLHNCYINLPVFFQYIKKHNIPVVWTLHDCWSFTGQCPHFAMIKCDKWKTGCHDCPQYRQYPQSYVDRTKTMWKLKKKWFTGVQNMTIATPSQWLADLVKESFLAEYPVKVINNGIDLGVFKPTESDFRGKYGLHDKKIVLGVAFGWDKRKGLDVFIELAQRLSGQYQIVLVGTNEDIDRKLPNNIISIHRTHDQKELAEIYTAADVFVNPTREENYPTVNMEALACGTPVVTFRTGGSPEILGESCGFVVQCDDIGELRRKLENICKDKSQLKIFCLKRAESFNKNERLGEYIALYHSIIGESSDEFQKTHTWA